MGCSPWVPLGATASSAKDRKSTRLNSSHSQISYAGSCLKQRMPETSTNTAPRPYTSVRAPVPDSPPAGNRPVVGRLEVVDSEEEADASSILFFYRKAPPVAFRSPPQDPPPY